MTPIMIAKWLCGHHKNGHNTVDDARACITKHSMQKSRRSIEIQRQIRFQRCLDYRAQGMTFKDIGNAFGVSSQRARQILEEAERKSKRWSSAEYALLPYLRHIAQ